MLNVQSKSHAIKTTLQLENLVDEFIILDSELSSMKEKIERHSKLKKQLASECNTFGNGEVRLVGHLGYAIFSKPSIKRTLKSVKDFISTVGVEDAAYCLTVSITKAAKVLTEPQQARLFDESVGSRRLKHCEMLGGISSGATANAKQLHH